MGYGLNDDSRIEAHGREEVLSWAVSRVQDTLGNYYSVTYQEETTHTEYRPLRIDYTSNDNAGLLPYNSVEFSYEDRVYQDNSTTPSTGYTDSFFRYIGGAPLKTTKRLYKIQALENNAVYREYRLTYKPYESDAMIYRSRLASIQECGSDDSCFAPTAFEWQEDATTKFDAEYDLIPQSEIDKLNGRKGEFYPADWNGDGLTDMLWVEKYSGKNIFYLNKRVNGHCPHDSGCYDKIEDVIESSTLGNQWTYSGGYFYFQNCKFTITPSEKDFSQLQLGDWNGDGLTDFMVYKPVDCRGGTFYRGGNYWYVNNGDMTFSVASNPISSSLLQGKNTYTELVTGDWNGDGRTDIMWHQPGLSRKSRWFINAGPSDNQDINFTDKGEPFVIGQTTQVRLGDWNGDGITDVMVFGNEDWWYINDGNLNMTLSNPLEELYGDDDFDGRGVPYFGDWNGDGITDFMYRSSDKTRWYINHGLMSDGKLKFTLIEDPISNDAVQSSQLYLGDRNGDGISDLFLRNGGENHWYVNNGNLNFTITENNISQGDISAGDIYTGDWNGDGIMDVLVYNKDTGDNSWHVSNITRYNLLTKITDGHGKTVEISYKPLTSNDVFLVKQRDIEAFIGVAESSVAYPELDMRAPLYVVDSYYADNGIGGRNKSSYRYVGARMNLHGRGFRGFMLMEVNDEASGRCRITQFSQDYRHAGSRIVKSTEYAVSPGLRCFDDPNAKVVSETENTLAYKKWPDPMQGYEPACVKYDLILFPLTLTLCSPPPPEQEYGLFYFSYIKSVITKQYELDALKDPNGPPIPFRVKTIDQEYDDYGNPTNITINHGGGYTETTVNTYDNNTSQWHLGRLRTAKVTKTVLGQAAQTRVSAFEYSSTTGLLTKEIIQPGDPLCLEKAYTHDSYGNVRTSATRGCSSTNPPIESRTHTTEYDNDGRFVIKSINTLGHEETKTYEHGNLASRTGPNGLTTTWEYDGFGRQILETRADGAQTRASYHLCSGCFPNSVYYVWTEASGSPPSAVVYDKLDREIVRGVYAFGGEIILAETRYNDIGQTIEVSEPYFLDIVPTSRLWTQNQYDALSRIKRQTVPDGGAAITEYQGLTTVVTNPLGQRSTRTINALGQLARSEDNQGNALTYIYDAFGNLIELRDPENNVTQISYDIRGNKKQLIDPDTGTTSYQYNALGELLSQTDNKNQTVTMRYDRLGRMIERAAPEGLSTWEYDTATNGIGKLAKVTCVTCADGYAQTLRYDSFGRPDEVIVTIDGKPFPVTAVYDRYGRKDTVTYPSGFAVKNIYDQRGYLSEVRNAASDKNYWKAQTVNARGQFESFTLGNGLNTQKVYDDLSGRIFSIQTSAIQNLSFEFDELGNLKRRNKNGRIETFTYDDLNRLKRAAVQDGESVTLDYDALGNIKYKSDVGSYSYGANGAGPHAVTGVNGVLNNTYQYDLNGNRISAEREGQTIDYTSYNKPFLISQGGTSLKFHYGPDHSRYRQTVDANGMTETKLYIGSLYEQVSDSGLTKKIHYIFAGDESIAVYTSQSDGEENTRYLHKDHLGSIDAISDEQGDLVESLSF
ncbi:MAG: hypothetical protein GY862_31275, partial [Gammaproteobacteria bacterium]|nr:hypothetical protein [Gammaproteobacteria bacterium]